MTPAEDFGISHLVSVAEDRGQPESAAERALAYARRGWPVFPVIPGEKVPPAAHGLLDATTDPSQITAWWNRSPGRNIGVATGVPGPDVVDVDVRESGSGFPAWNRLVRDGVAGMEDVWIAHMDATLRPADNHQEEQ